MSTITYPHQHRLVTETFWYAPLEYDVSNHRVLAQFDGNGGVSKYSVAGEWSILSEKSWFTSWTVNGKRLSSAHRKKVTALGRILDIDYDSSDELDGVSVRAQQYSGNTNNEIYIRFKFENQGKRPAKLFLRHGMFWEIKSYMAAMVAINKNYQYQELEAQWNRKRTVWEALLGEGYRVHLASSHPAVQIEEEGLRMILDYEDEVSPGQTITMVLGLSGGAKPAASEDLIDRAEVALEEVQRYNRWLKSRFSTDNATLNSLFASCLNVAHSSYKESGEEFTAFYAGVNYQSPSRTYFRDGYWTVLPILPFKPSWVRNEILTLAHGINEDGSCPSAVIYNVLEKQFEPFWPDHYDSPSFFIMMIHDYLAWTHDRTLLNIKIGERTVFQVVSSCLHKLESHTDDGLKQLVKPENRRDWCDNVVRQGLVTYDALLYIRARACFAEILRFIGNEAEASDLERMTAAITNSLRNLLWTKEVGYMNYRNTGGLLVEETNVSIEQALAAVFGIGSEEDQTYILDILTKRLETKHNNEQPFGDWGVMTCFPAYTHVPHLVEKSAYPFRYHNGSDWPYWSGILAWAKLKHNREDWEYPLSRWFTYSLERQWLTPVEYYDPVFGKGSNLQGWSSMPAAAVLFGGMGLYPELNKDLQPKVPPWGDCQVRGIYFRGTWYDCMVENGELHMTKCQGQPDGMEWDE